MKDSIRIKIVESEEERFKAMIVRAIVYMHEQRCPYDEEFDLNDHAATQVVGLTPSGEPVLTARIRWFDGFAKLERAAIRAEHRGGGLAHRLVDFTVEVAQRKGYRRFYLHAQAHLRALYEAHGFRVVGDAFAFSDHAYLEMLRDDESPTACPALDIGRRPMRLNRPDDRPTEIGPLERSARELPVAAVATPA